jgi:hypothetical protein
MGFMNSAFTLKVKKSTFNKLRWFFTLSLTLALRPEI